MVLEQFPYGRDNDEKKITPEKKDKNLIHRVITEMGKETNQDTLDKLIKGCPDDTSPVEMKEGVNNENDVKLIGVPWIT